MSELLVNPEQSFEPIKLGSEKLPEQSRVAITEPLNRFLNDRFRALTSREQAKLLALVDAKIQSDPNFNPKDPPLQLHVMHAKLNVEESTPITAEQAADFYLDYSSGGRRIWFDRLARDPATAPLVEDKIFEHLATQLPSIAYTLAHIYEGGHYGHLTARGDRANHVRQIEVIGQVLGFAPEAELSYYVNDDKLGKRLSGIAADSAERKFTVLVNFANGLKNDENGNVVPMTTGKRFDEIIFTDDEDKNLRTVMQCLVRDVCSNVLYEAGLRYRTDGIERKITQKSKEYTETAYAKDGVKATEDIKFWVATVDKLLQAFNETSDTSIESAAIIEKLMTEKKWLPDVLKVLDGRTIPIDETLQRLRTRLHDPAPLELGSKRSVIFNDIDGNLLVVMARFYVTQVSNPKAGRLLTLTQAEFAEHPNATHWIEQVSKKTGIAASDLSFSYEHFRDARVIENDILAALHKGEITKNPYNNMH